MDFLAGREERMSDITRQLLESALLLPPVERVVLVERLLQSLNRPEAQTDEPWAREAEDRLAAYDSGQMKAIPAEEVFSDLK